ncbi:uncharacterized protein LOC110693112 [Chenopodium quinoa]|uniref:uncharacterized protein LOC110693112 n=1 Tax=Chenopodium quinoa TaxID=63459 RepID=UPI000B777F3B|nr:uncharacterized protein LOC110693112 [Chenopodium quinoa]
MSSGLLGPPELQSTIHATTISAQPTTHSPSSNQTKTLSYLSSANPCLDFFHVVQETTPLDLIQRLQFSWQNSPLTTLKLICNLRGVRGTGKNIKEGFYAAALWLHQNHPKTLALNAGVFARFGSLKDLLEILFRILEGVDVRKRMKDEWESKKPAFFAQRYTKKAAAEDDLKKAKVLKAEKKANKAKKAIDRYNHDPEYRFLYDCICAVFGNLLKTDMKLLKEGDYEDISLAAKWCPSLDSSYDEYLLICESIARKVFPREEYKEYDGVEEAHYAYRVRTRLRKEVLVPLRKALELPEVYMCAKRWRDIPYDRVASTAMNLGKKVFLKRDRDGFEEYLTDVKEGDMMISAGSLLPHEIVSSLYDSEKELNEVAELQWKRMVDDLDKQGKLINCSALANNIAGDACIGLMLLVSELTSEPWKGKVIIWGEDPKFHNIEGDKLVEKVESIKDMLCESRVDLEKVFDKILEFTIEKNLSEDQMLRRLFVFIDEEFMKVSDHPWETEYAGIKTKFLDRGFEKVPEVVFWNVKGSLAVPVRCDVPGMAVVSGLLKNLLTLFLDDGGVLTPESVMNAAISSPEYDQLVVHD